MEKTCVKYTIWVNGKNALNSGYLQADGSVKAWPTFSLRFNTLEEASQALADKGLVYDTSARPGILTAYICEV